MEVKDKKGKKYFFYASKDNLNLFESGKVYECEKIDLAEDSTTRLKVTRETTVKVVEHLGVLKQFENISNSEYVKSVIVIGFKDFVPYFSCMSCKKKIQEKDVECAKCSAKGDNFKPYEDFRVKITFDSDVEVVEDEEKDDSTGVLLVFKRVFDQCQVKDLTDFETFFSEKLHLKTFKVEYDEKKNSYTGAAECILNKLTAQQE